MTVSPLITVVVPTYNSAEFVSGCLESISAQAYGNLEVIVMDGVSKDDTLQLVAEFANGYPCIKVFSELDNGVYDAINKGVKLAKGEWIYILGSDDRLAGPTALQDLLPLLRSDAQLIHAKVFRMSSGAIEARPSVGIDIVRKNICQQAILYRRELFEILGFFNLRYPICADWEFNIRCFGLPCKVVHADTLLCHYDGGGMSARVTDELFYAERLDVALRAYGLPPTHATFRPVRYLFDERSTADRKQGKLLRALGWRLVYFQHALLARLESPRG